MENFFCSLHSSSPFFFLFIYVLFFLSCWPTFNSGKIFLVGYLVRTMTTVLTYSWGTNSFEMVEYQLTYYFQGTWGKWLNILQWNKYYTYDIKWTIKKVFGTYKYSSKLKVKSDPGIAPVRLLKLKSLRKVTFRICRWVRYRIGLAFTCTFRITHQWGRLTAFVIVWSFQYKME